ncbi:MAG: hypothetical protein B6I24_03670 [Bacteroidetes bacterium 4572_128]|nr:MAG: hypothetical protein B6I24_03670 [Bacteroidetes bacterium 4572_128]
MEAYKFETMVLENGVLEIPEISRYKNRMIEIIIMLNPVTEKVEKKKSIDDFFEKWSGRFAEVEIDDIRYNALMEKHR